MNWQEEYAARRTTADAAVKIVKSGDRVAIPVYPNPSLLAAALAHRLNDLTAVTILLGAVATDLPWYHPEAAEAFQIEPWYTSPYVPKPIRQMVIEKRSDHRVCPSALLCKTLNEGRADTQPPDVVLLDVSPPDHNGFVSFGTGVWDKKDLVQHSRTVIAEVNPGFIRTGGDNFVHLPRNDYFVERPHPEEVRPPLPAPEPSEPGQPNAPPRGPPIRGGGTVWGGAGSTTQAVG